MLRQWIAWVPILIYRQYFEARLQAMVLPEKGNRINKRMVVWEELFENGVDLNGKDGSLIL